MQYLKNASFNHHIFECFDAMWNLNFQPLSVSSENLLQFVLYFTALWFATVSVNMLGFKKCINYVQKLPLRSVPWSPLERWHWSHQMVLIPGGPFWPCRTATKGPASSGIQLTDVCYILEVVHLMVAGEGLWVDVQLPVPEVQVLNSDLTRLKTRKILL